MTISFWIALVLFIVTTGIGLNLYYGIKQLGNLADVAPMDKPHASGVSIIIPACNEGATLQPALQSALGLDYDDLEIIVVNDRSTDDTARVLEQMKEKHPSLQVLTIETLPAGWMGKHHALHTGAQAASGTYLLFTDADVIFEKSTLARAIHHMSRTGLDHLSLLFKNTAPGGLLNALILDGSSGLLLLYQPWKARNPKSKRFMGVGAFNLVKASAYRAIGGHSDIAMHPIDDIMLGKLIKQHGFSQECLIAYGFVQLAWYASAKELIDGVMKNAFSLYEYRIRNLLASLLMLFFFNILPVWALFFTTGPAFALFLALVVFRLLSMAMGLSTMGLPLRHCLWALITPYVSLYVSIKAAVITIRNKGITWRGTHYPLKELKKGIRI